MPYRPHFALAAGEKLIFPALDKDFLMIQIVHKKLEWLHW